MAADVAEVTDIERALAADDDDDDGTAMCESDAYICRLP